MIDPFDYIESRADADELIAEFGQNVIVRKMVASGPAASPTLTPSDFPTQAVILDYTARQIDGENVQMTDRRALVAAGPIPSVTEIVPPDQIVVGGKPIPVIRTMPLAPAGTIVMFECQLRF